MHGREREKNEADSQSGWLINANLDNFIYFGIICLLVMPLNLSLEDNNTANGEKIVFGVRGIFSI